MSFIGEPYYAKFSENENKMKYGKNTVDFLMHTNTNFPEEFSTLNKNYPPPAKTFMLLLYPNVRRFSKLSISSSHVKNPFDFSKSKDVPKHLFAISYALNSFSFNVFKYCSPIVIFPSHFLGICVSLEVCTREDIFFLPGWSILSIFIIYLLFPFIINIHQFFYILLRVRRFYHKVANVWSSNLLNNNNF